MYFTTETMQDILPLLQKYILKNDTVTFQVINPDIGDRYAGSIIVINKQSYMYRGYKSWVDLAELLSCKMLTPKENEYPYISITFKKLTSNSFHDTKKSTEKYGVNSSFSHIYKMEEPAFYYYYLEALKNVKIEAKTKILNLGINRADEFTIIKNELPPQIYKNISLTGIDYSSSAIAYAKKKFPEDNVKLHTQDINDIDKLNLTPFNLLISIGTLQSSSIEFKPLFMKLVQKYLTQDAAIILGFPNSRWQGGEMIYGAKVPHYAMSELGLLFSDVLFCKKYLQQKKYRVTLTGKQYIFLTATRINSYPL